MDVGTGIPVNVGVSVGADGRLHLVSVSVWVSVPVFV